jgi:DNA-binding LacI/PurR family transcriptional regulator
MPRSKRKATRADVARLAGVSASTVTYALTGERSISEETRARIMDAMAELNYTPNAMAQGLASRRSGLIALSFPVGERGFETSDYDYVEAATEVLAQAGYQLLLWPNPVEDLESLRRIVSQGLIDGVLLMEVRRFDPRIPVLQAANVPFVLIGRTDTADDLTWVDADFSQWGPMAINHLADLGHTSVGVIGLTEELFTAGYGPVVRTERDLIAAAKERNVTLDIKRVLPTVRAGQEAMQEILDDKSTPTALIGFNEPAVVGAIEVVTARGMSIPGDFSLLQFGISEEGALATVPPQTTIGVESKTLASTAANYLAEQLASTNVEPRHYLGEAVFTDRGSTAPVPGKKSSRSFPS